MARYVLATGGGGETGTMDGSGLIFMVGMIVMSAVIMSMLIFGCADGYDDDNKPSKRRSRFYGTGAVAGGSACGGGGGGGGSACGGGGGGGGSACGGGGGGGC